MWPTLFSSVCLLTRREKVVTGLTPRRHGNVGIGRQQGPYSTGLQALPAISIARPLAPVLWRGREPGIEAVEVRGKRRRRFKATVAAAAAGVGAAAECERLGWRHEGSE